MPGGKTQYKPSWGSQKAGNGDLINSWCCSSSTSVFSGYRKLYKTNISVDNSGINKLLQHAKYKKHVKIRNVVLSPGQSKLTATVKEDKDQPGTSSTTTVAVSYDSLDVIKAETIWAMKVASSDMSYRSCEGISSTFDAMFHCPISKSFKLSRSKVSYVISGGLGPYFQKKLIYDINSSKNRVTLHYDWNNHSSGTNTDGFTFPLLVRRTEWNCEVFLYSVDVWACRRCQGCCCHGGTTGGWWS